MTDLKTKARLALEGSDRSEGALEHVRDYLYDLRLRLSLAIEDVALNVEMLLLLDELEELSNPDGDSAYVMQIVPRKRTGTPPNPAIKRKRATKALFAAVYADKLIRENPNGLKKGPISRAAERFGVTVGELYAARKTRLYREAQVRPKLAERLENEGITAKSL